MVAVRRKVLVTLTVAPKAATLFEPLAVVAVRRKVFVTLSVAPKAAIEKFIVMDTPTGRRLCLMGDQCLPNGYRRRI